MYAKLVILTLALIGLAASLLVMRQQRIELAHRAARLHHQIIQTRQDIWRQQALASEKLSPRAIKQQLDQSNLTVEHFTAQAPGAQTAIATPPRGPTVTN